MRADGTHVRRLTDSPGSTKARVVPRRHEISSPATRRPAEIYVIDADGSNPRPLTGYPARDESPD